MFDVSYNNYFVVYWFVVALLYLFSRIAICFFDFGVLNANHVFLSYSFPDKRFFSMMLGFAAIVFCLEKYNIDNNVLLFRQTRGLGSMTTQIILMFDVSNNNYFAVYWFVVALLYLFWRIAIWFFDFGFLLCQPCISILCFSDKQFYSMLICFDGNSVLHWKVQYSQ